MIDLRNYQKTVIGDLERAIRTGRRRVVIVAPTGAGKTVIGAAIIHRARDAGRSVLVLAHTREIVTQTSLKLFAKGIDHGIILAGTQSRIGCSVQIASIQTLHARAIRGNRMELPPADLVLVDECHHATADTWQKIISSYPNAVIVGLTATPCRGDGRGLGGVFEVLIECPQIAELIEQKFLVKTRVYAPADPDLRGVETRQGDYVELQLAERMDRPKLIGDIVSHWHKFGQKRKTVCFATSVEHSLHLRDEFNRSGVRAAHLDGSTPKHERDEILKQLAVGDVDVVSNCAVLVEGFDLPEMSCCILARPTKKMGLFRQMVGRVLRPAPGKTDALILDHSGAVFRHGFVEDPVEWTLAPDKSASSPKHAERLRTGYSSRLLECSKCSAIRVAGERCEQCGFLPQRQGNAVNYVDGDLALVDRRQRVARSVSDPNEHMRWHAMLVGIAIERGYASGWISHKYREKFGTWPPRGRIAPVQPSAEVLSWVRSRNIAFAKAKAKAGEAA